MKKYLLIALGALLANTSFGQNLVPNGDFSKMINPPSNNNLILHNIFEDWFAPNVEGIHTGIISYKMTDPSFFNGIPNRPPSYYLSPTADSSYCMVGVWHQTTVGINSRSYISTRLSETIEQGRYYRFSMDYYLFGTAYSTNYSNNIGMAFTDSLSVNIRELIPDTPVFNVDNPVTTYNNWYSVDTCLIVNRTADFMTIGNFFDDNNTITNPNSTQPVGFGVDNIFLERLELTLSSGDTVFGCRRDPLVLEATKDCWYKWARKNDPNNILHDGPRFEFTPTVSESFLVYGLTDTLEVFVMLDDRIGVNLGEERYLCPDDSVGFDLSNLMADKIFWSTGDTTESIYVKSPGELIVQVQRGHCVEFDTVRIIEETLPQGLIEAEKEFVCLGDEQILRVQERARYNITWSNGERTHSISVNESGLVGVEIRNPCGIHTDSLEVIIEPCTCNVFLPNAFKPLSSIESNRQFGPGGECVYTEYDLKVFNRWGSMVFHTRDPYAQWDGRQSNGEVFPMGVYTYIYSYSGFNERGLQTQETRRGTVTLIH